MQVYILLSIECFKCRVHGDIRIDYRDAFRVGTMAVANMCVFFKLVDCKKHVYTRLYGRITSK